jgi:hypothetical protein
MRAAARSIVFVVSSFAPWMPACVGSGDDSTGLMATEGGSGDAAGGDAHPVDGTIGDASPTDAPRGEAMSGDGTADGPGAVTTTSTVAGLRVANWSPDAPAVDFCIASHGSNAFRGPIVAAASGDAGGGALGFPKVSAYSFVTPGAYDLRIVVAAPGTDCSLGGLLVPDTTLGAGRGLAPGSNTTLALVGMAQSPGADSGLQLQFVVLSDDPVGPPSSVPLDGGPVTGRFAVRFVHAAPALPPADLLGTPVDLTGTGLAGTKWSFKSVPFGHANPWKDGGTDPNSYQVVSAVPPTAVVKVQLSGQDAGAPDLFPAPTVTAAGGSVLTMVLAGTQSMPADTQSMGAPVQLLGCVDNGGTTTAFSTCRTLSVSTCGNGIRDAFEECDCGSNGVSTDPQCAATTLSGAMQLNKDDVSYLCSTTCHLN